MPRRPRKKEAANGASKNGETRWQGHDPVFFHRQQVKVGVRFVNFGRMDHGSIWEVIQIYTHVVLASGNIRRSQVEQVERLSDDVLIRRQGRNDPRRCKFSTLSYSAIWRIS